MKCSPRWRFAVLEVLEGGIGKFTDAVLASAHHLGHDQGKAHSLPFGLVGLKLDQASRTDA